MHIFFFLLFFIWLLAAIAPFALPCYYLAYFNNKYGIIGALIIFFMCASCVIPIIEMVKLNERHFYLFIIGTPILIMSTILGWRAKKTTNVYSVTPGNFLHRFIGYFVIFCEFFAFCFKLYDCYDWDNNSFCLPDNPIETIFIYILGIISFIFVFLAIYVKFKGKIPSAPYNYFSLKRKYGTIHYWYVLEHFEGQCILVFKKHFYVCGNIYNKKDILDVSYSYKDMTITTKDDIININLEKTDDKAFQDHTILEDFFYEMASINKKNNTPLNPEIKLKKMGLVKFNKNTED